MLDVPLDAEEASPPEQNLDPHGTGRARDESGFVSDELVAPVGDPKLAKGAKAAAGPKKKAPKRAKLAKSEEL